MVLTLGRCLELIWFSGVFSVAFFCGKNTFQENFSLREFVILSLAWTCPCRNYFWSFWSCIFLPAEVLFDPVAGKLFFLCYSFLQMWYCVWVNLRIHFEIKWLFLFVNKKFISSFNVPKKLLLSSSKPLFMLLVFWCTNFRNRAMFRNGHTSAVRNIITS